MTIAVNVRIRGMDRVQRLVSSLPKNLQEDIGNANYNYTKVVERNLKNQLMRTSQRWAGNSKIYPGIRAQRMSKFKSVVKMPVEGVWLDSMKPHWVSLKRGRKITRWAEDRGVPGYGVTGNAIYVRPHPFIDVALTKSRQKLPRGLKRSLQKSIRRSKK